MDDRVRLTVQVPGDGYHMGLISCQVACPVHTDARGYVRAIANNRFEEAYLIARGPNPLASICGRVCGAPCEVACRRGKVPRVIKPAVGEYYSAIEGPRGELPVTERMLLDRPSGDLFGWTQSAGMGWDPRDLGKPEFLILTTLGGIRAEDGTPVALGYHTGHWEIGLLMQAAAAELYDRAGRPSDATRCRTSAAAH